MEPAVVHALEKTAHLLGPLYFHAPKDQHNEAIHSVRVMHYARTIAKLRAPHVKQEVTYAGLTHDVARMLTPRELLESMTLTEEDFREVCEHVENAKPIINGLEFPGVDSKIYRFANFNHHENNRDPSRNYPRESNPDKPVGSRMPPSQAMRTAGLILTTADVYDRANGARHHGPVEESKLAADISESIVEDAAPYVNAALGMHSYWRSDIGQRQINELVDRAVQLWSSQELIHRRELKRIQREHLALRHPKAGAPREGILALRELTDLFF